MMVPFGANLARVRRQRGCSQAALAQAVGVSRQAIIALEKGEREPHLGLAAALAQQLEVTLDELIAGKTDVTSIKPQVWVQGEAPAFPTPVVWSSINHRLVVATWSSLAFPTTVDAWWDPASERLTPLPGARQPERVAFLAGCDPFLSALQREFEVAIPGCRLEVIPLSSQRALEALRRGAVHVAGSHLFDPVSRTYNHISGLPFSVRRLPYLKWQEGIIQHSGASSPRLWAVREAGSEAAALWRRCRPREADGSPALTFSRHGALVDFVADHQDVCGVSLGALATLHGLQFHPWAEEEYDWCFPAQDETSWWVTGLAQLRSRASLAKFFDRVPYVTLAHG